MSELNISENIDLYSLEPNSNIIEFKLDTDDISELSSNTTEINSKENEIKIKNNSDNYLAFKIKTTQKDNYALSSGYFILFPKNEKIITIKFRRMEGVKLKLKSHKVLIEGFAVNDEEKDLDALKMYQRIKDLLNGNNDYQKMKNNLRKLDMKNASTIIYEQIKELIK